MSASNPFLAPRTALITGASSGIGLELAHLFARDGYRLVLVARNRGALRELGDELQSRYCVEVRISPKDLAHPASPGELYQELQEAGIVLDVLVNNAGFGGGGPFLDTDWNNEAEMIQVNIVALTHLTKLFLPQIRAREGKVMNVASMAAFLPGPFMSVYYASKALRAELHRGACRGVGRHRSDRDVPVPGAGGDKFSEARSNRRTPSLRNGPLLVDVREVARVGYEGMKQGKRVVIPGWKNRAGRESRRHRAAW